MKTFQPFTEEKMNCFDVLFSNSGYKVITYGSNIYAFYGAQNKHADFGWRFGNYVDPDRRNREYKTNEEAMKACQAHFEKRNQQT